MMKLWILLFVVFSVSSCADNGVPSDMIPPDKMEKILWEQIKADAFTNEFIARDGTKDLTVENQKIQQKIFAKYNTSKAAFYKSYEYYINHEDLLRPLLDTMIARNGRVRENQRIKNLFKPQ